MTDSNILVSVTFRNSTNKFTFASTARIAEVIGRISELHNVNLANQFLILSSQSEPGVALDPDHTIGGASVSPDANGQLNLTATMVDHAQVAQTSTDAYSVRLSQLEGTMPRLTNAVARACEAMKEGQRTYTYELCYPGSAILVVPSNPEHLVFTHAALADSLADATDCSLEKSPNHVLYRDYHLLDGALKAPDQEPSVAAAQSTTSVGSKAQLQLMTSKDYMALASTPAQGTRYMLTTRKQPINIPIANVMDTVAQTSGIVHDPATGGTMTNEIVAFWGVTVELHEVAMPTLDSCQKSQCTPSVLVHHATAIGGFTTRSRAVAVDNAVTDTFTHHTLLELCSPLGTSPESAGAAGMRFPLKGLYIQ